MNEIERKFLLTKLPKSLSPAPIQYERYFLKITPSYEERVQKKGDVYQREKKLSYQTQHERQKKQHYPNKNSIHSKKLHPKQLSEKVMHS